MDTPVLPKRVPEEAVVGARASFSRTFTEADAALFIGVTWDINPYHTDEVFASQTRFKRRIIPGLLTVSLFTHLGGLWAFLATSMHFDFIAPVYVGDTITAEMEVIEADQERGWVRLRASGTNADGLEVMQGEVTGYPGRFETRSG
jgi:acyl dehydratase